MSGGSLSLLVFVAEADRFGVKTWWLWHGNGMKKSNQGRPSRRYPVISLSAEHLVIGHLMRRNILAYKAPPQNEGYDLICIHPDPRVSSASLRIQVKSRYQTDCDRGFPVKEKSLDAFDYVVVAFLNVGYYYRKRPVLEGRQDPEFYTLSREFIRRHHHIVSSGWEKVLTKGIDLEPYKNELGFDLIAEQLRIPYPGFE